MKESHITNPNTKSSFTIWQHDNFEKINPIELFKEAQIRISISLLLSGMLNELQKRGLPIETEILSKVLFKKASEEWYKQYQVYLSLPIPHGLFEVLESNTKKEQIKALKGISLSSTEFIAYLIKAYLNYGYTLSHYSSTHHHNGLDKSELPPFILKEDDDKITSIGNTKLTKGQLKQALNHRRVTVAKFLDKDNKWHCFFLTYKSLKGEETAYKGGQPHLHFISHTWGLSREYVLSQLTSKDYKLPSLPHIDFTM